MARIVLRSRVGFFAVFLTEPFHAAGRIDELSLAGVEWMARGADIRVDARHG